jgi:hypothetical protein
LAVELAGAFLLPVELAAPLLFVDCDPLAGADGPCEPLALAGCDPALADCAVLVAGVDPFFTAAVLLACGEFPGAGCDPFFTAGEPFPAGAGEGDVLACGAGDFTGVAAVVPDFWPGAGVAVGLGFAC